MIVVHEVVPKSFRKSGWVSQGTLHEWVKASDGFLDVAFRQFGYSGTDVLRNAHVWKSKSGFGGANDNLFLVRSGTNFSLLVRFVAGEDLSATALDSLRRPGLDINQQLAKALSVEFETGINLYSIAVSNQSEILDEAAAKDGWLVVEHQSKDPLANQSEKLMLAISVATERALINQATILISKPVGNLLRNLSFLNQIRKWPTLPPIDNTALAERYLSLRSSLNLDIRRNDILHALELKERKLGTTLTVLTVVAAMAALILDAATNWSNHVG